MTKPPALSLPESLNLEALAQDMARQLLTPDQILQKHEISASQLRQLLSNDGFLKQVGDHARMWSADESVDERTRIKAKMAEEDALAEMHHIVKNPIAAPADRISAFKAIQQSAGTPKQGKDQGGPSSGGSQVNIQINLNGKEHNLELSRTAIESDPIDAG